MYIPHELVARASHGLYSSPPNAQTAVTRNPGLLVSWWCTVFALTIIIVRLVGRYIRTEKLFREDKIMAWSIAPLLLRMAFAHCVLRWGTNNAVLTGMTPLELYRRELGSKLVLPARILYAAFLWTAKYTVAEFLRRLYGQVWKKSYQQGLYVLRGFLAVTFIAVCIGTLTECAPFHHYWQVLPDPGPHCRQAYTQLLTLGAADIVTDLVLVCFPIPILLKSSLPIKRKIQLAALFSLSLILIATTLYRITGTIERHGNQQFRSLLASLEILAAAACSNAIVLGSFIRDRGVKKQRFKFGSTSGNSSTLDRPSIAKTRPLRAALSYGSDVDLFESLGIRLGPEFAADRSSVARPAPVVLALVSPSEEVPPGASSMTFPGRDSSENEETDFKLHHMGNSRPASPSDGLTPQGMSFFDVGGLLVTDPPQRASSVSVSAPTTGILTQTKATTSLSMTTFLSRPPLGSSNLRQRSPRGSRRGSEVLLQDLGGLLDLPRLTETMSAPATAIPRQYPSSDGSRSSRGH